MTEEEQGQGSAGNESGASFSDSGCHKGVGKGVKHTVLSMARCSSILNFPNAELGVTIPSGVHLFGKEEQADCLGAWRPRCSFTESLLFRKPK